MFFVSDTHFGHAKIIEYCDRPFNNVEEMDEYLISAWNETVQANDDIYILGDFALMKAEAAGNPLDKRGRLTVKEMPNQRVTATIKKDRLTVSVIKKKVYSWV